MFLFRRLRHQPSPSLEEINLSSTILDASVISRCLSRSPRRLCDESTMISPRLFRSPRRLREKLTLIFPRLSLLDDSAMNLSVFVSFRWTEQEMTVRQTRRLQLTIRDSCL